MKKFFIIAISIMMLCAVGFLTVGCNNTDTDEINVYSREPGSGTRSAFIELTGVEEKDADGNKVDKTFSGAAITDKTNVMLSSVSGDKRGIGYVSLGSLNDSVKAVSVAGVVASAATVKDGTYKLARPFNVAYKADNAKIRLPISLSTLLPHRHRKSSATTVMSALRTMLLSTSLPKPLLLRPSSSAAPPPYRL